MTKSSNGFVLDEINDRTLQEEVFTIRIPTVHKIKYEVIQARSRKKFASYVREKLIEVIESVDIPTDGFSIQPKQKEG